MAYVQVPGIEYDIFISYARVDNKTGWVDTFIDTLVTDLTIQIGRENTLAYFRDDESLTGNRIIHKTIQHALKKSAVFLALTSNGFFHPECYCGLELAWFNKYTASSSAGKVLEDCSRIFNVRLMDIPQEKWYKEFKGSLGFPMFRPATATVKRSRPLNPDSADYKKNIEKINDALLETLEKINSMQIQKPVEEKLHEPGVFIADISHSTAIATGCTAIHLKLISAGYDLIAPPTPDASDPDLYQSQLKKELENAVLAIYLIDTDPGKDLNPTPHYTLQQNQFSMTEELNIPAFIWSRDNIWSDDERMHNLIPDPSYRGFLEKLKKNPSADICTGEEEYLPGQIIEKLSKLKPLFPVPDAQEQQVFIDFHQNEGLQYINEISSLFSTKGCRSLIYQDINDLLRHDAEFINRLNLAKNLLIYYGSVEQNWIIERVKAAKKELAMQPDENNRYRPIGIYLPPSTDHKLDLASIFPDTKMIKLLDNSKSDEFDPSSLSPFLRDLGLETTA